MALVRSRWVELFWRWHPGIYRATGGLVGGKLVGLPVLLLETLGRAEREADSASALRSGSVAPKLRQASVMLWP